MAQWVKDVVGQKHEREKKIMVTRMNLLGHQCTEQIIVTLGKVKHV